MHVYGYIQELDKSTLLRLNANAIYFSYCAVFTARSPWRDPTTRQRTTVSSWFPLTSTEKVGQPSLLKGSRANMVGLHILLVDAYK